MIQNLYETHLQVKDLDKSIEFFEKLGLKLAHRINERKCAFFFIGNKEQMIGIWEVPEQQEIERRHFAFSVSLDDLSESIKWLKKNEIRLSEDFFGREPIEPIVFAWMPSASVYFYDPDGNDLEFISMLDGDPADIDEMLYLSEWNEFRNKVLK
ncbi:VOC family protein [Bacillus solimangrovi]|uniref:Fosmidomycin resistance protein n=1 Tax=Bacillus solimangrovi TaxID=1305675 RepID=A0A1E5LK27_9BACI|nr:VOC family protein [Bacillus solimangrovi]OEH94440.1 fosmidomycin resistance protein [Bacillus solimangrovi]